MLLGRMAEEYDEAGTGSVDLHHQKTVQYMRISSFRIADVCIKKIKETNTKENPSCEPLEC